MIGGYLGTLTPKQEHAVLTERLAYAPGIVRDDGCRCLMGVTEGWYRINGMGPLVWPGDKEAIRVRSEGRYRVVGDRFDRLCIRFGEGRVNTAIRNRILTNQARRELAPVTVGLGV